MPDPINTLPIVLAAIPAPIAITAQDFNQLLTNIAQYLSASVQQNVFFVQEFDNPPASFEGNIIFSTNRQNFYAWNSTTGQYDAISQFRIGDVTQSVILGDDPSNGWVRLDGRTISSITGLSAPQIAALNGLFPFGILPNIAYLGIFPVDSARINGGFTSGSFDNLELVEQAITLATAIIDGGQSSGTSLLVNAVQGRPDATNIWTGADSGATFTPTSFPNPNYGPAPVASRVYVGPP